MSFRRLTSHARRFSLRWLFGVYDQASGGDQNERRDYVRQGENVLHGQAFCGLVGREELLDPPGDAILSAGVTFLVRNSDVATKIIYLLVGVGLIFPTRQAI